MRKVIATFLFLCIALTCFASKEYIINTSQGDKIVCIPDDMSETDVLLLLAESYYEKSYEYDELQKQSEKLIAQTEQYVSAKKQLEEQYKDLQKDYQKVISDYDILVKKIETKNKLNWFRGLIGARVNTDIKLSVTNYAVDFGAMFFDKVFLTTGISYPWSFSFGAMISF